MKRRIGVSEGKEGEKMDCSGMEDRFSDYCEKSLSPAEAEEVSRHLAVCARCRREYQAFVQTISLVQRLPEIPAPPQFLSTLRERIERETLSPWQKLAHWLDQSLSLVPLRALTAAAALILVLTLFLVSRPGAPPEKASLGNRDPGPAGLLSAGESGPLPAEFASTAPSATTDTIYLNTPTDFLREIIHRDPDWNKFPLTPHPRGSGLILLTPQHVIEVIMDPAEFPIIQAYIEQPGVSMPRTLREAKSLFPIYVRFLPSPLAPLPEE